MAPNSSRSRWTARCRWRLTIAIALAFLAGCGGATAPNLNATPASDAPAARFAVVDESGRTHRPFAEGKQAVCFFFVLPDCPIANGYAPELARIMSEHSQKAAFFVVYPDADVTPEKARQHAQEYSLPAPLVLDPNHAWVRRAAAENTPTAAVFNVQGELAYSGRIDDLYADYGQRRAQPSQHDLRDALTAVLAGQKVATPRTKVIGCPIP